MFSLFDAFKRQKGVFDLTDYAAPEDWGPEFPIPGTLRHNVPIPTLYSADGKLRGFLK